LLTPIVESTYLRAVYVALGPYLLYENLLIRNFILLKQTHPDCPKSAK